jgi:hypothetical protein
MSNYNLTEFTASEKELIFFLLNVIESKSRTPKETRILATSAMKKMLGIRDSKK